MPKSKPTSTLKYPDRKISDTFLQFAKPLLDAVGPSLTEAQMASPLMITWTVWNAVVFADAAGDKQMLEKVRESMEHDPQLAGFVEFLIDRKRMLFGDDQRLIGEYKLFRKDGEIRLHAEARAPRSRQP